MKRGRRLKELLRRYGRLALLVWILVWLGVLGAIFLVLEVGWSSHEGQGRSTWTNLVAAWALAQATYPARLAVLAVLVPVLERIQRRLHGQRRVSEAIEEEKTPAGSEPTAGAREDTEASPSLG